MRTSRFLLGLAIALAIATPGSSQAPDLAGVLPGDRWTYDVTDEMTSDLKYVFTVVVVDVSEKEINTRVTSRGAQRPRQIVFDRGWSRIDDDLWKYQPSDGTGIQMPLQLGKSWRFEGNGKNFQNGTTVRTSGQSKVTAEEKITTSAGTFETFKIETVVRHVNSNDQTKTGTLTSTLWYAPSINRWVRKTYKMQMEGRLRESQTEDLTDYSRKP
ncbi:MAG TPA: hypothetical protein VFR19_12145 [Hyphomicrobiaceae bacterium]|jgi:hypothetical protein|nr:hypothetical protein [Hyphomicrobiaceae bacterium]